MSYFLGNILLKDKNQSQPLHKITQLWLKLKKTVLTYSRDDPSSTEKMKSVFATKAPSCEEAAVRITDHLQGLCHSDLGDAS